MATTVITRAILFNIGGRKQCSSLYINKGGSRKTTSYAYANINGTRKQIYPYSSTTVYTYTWERYNATYGDSEENVYSVDLTQYIGYYLMCISRGTGSTVCPWSSTTNGFQIDCSESFLSSFETMGGYISEYVSSDRVGGEGKRAWAVILTESEYNTAQSTPVTKSVIYRGDGGIEKLATDKTLVRYSSRYMGLTKITKGYTKGSYVGTVTSSSRSTYPDDGISGSYWYVYKGQS